MFGFLGFGKKKKEQRDERQREVIRVALNNVLRRRGIAPQSIGCEIEPMSRPGAADLMLVQLIIRKWNEGLMNDAPDLEAELFDETEYGTKYRIRGTLTRPNGRVLRVLTIWMKEEATGATKFVTLMPDKL